MPRRPRTNTYFPSEIFKFRENDSLLDCGAFDGDTIRQALEVQPLGCCAIHAIEADCLSFRRLREFAAALPDERRKTLHLHHCAIGSKRVVVHFESDGSVNAKLSDRGPEIQMVPIDEPFSAVSLTIIKMDIEGAEYDALRGAAKVIQRDRPILAICVYHTQSDIWRIPLLVRDMAPEYKLYLRACEGDGFQTVLYAVPPERCLQASAP
jgi:FkbM family methyltransferase